jgi:signal transduction histidine kinase
MNETLDRLEDAVRRQQRFVADASHELRGPLTRIRSELEVDLARPELADPHATQRSILDEAIGLQHLVEDLLQLARSDAGAAEMTSAPVDLDDIVLREARRLRDRGRVLTDTSRVSAVQVTGDRDQLSRAVQNLLENAERHAATTVTVALDEIHGTARLTVTDDGAGIEPAQRERVFERFTRLDDARTRDSGGSGLGLAITRDIVERHGGTIHLAEGLATRFVVELPARP